MARSKSIGKRSELGSRKAKPNADLTERQRDDAAKFAGALDKILNDVHQRPLTRVPPYDRAAETLKREVYRLVRSLRNRTNGTSQIESAVLVTHRHRPRVDVDTDPFFWALKEVGRRLDWNAGKITRHAREMSYADRHDIDPDLFIGFILQTGTRKMHKADRGHVEAWFAAKTKDIDGSKND